MENQTKKKNTTLCLAHHRHYDKCYECWSTGSKKEELTEDFKEEHTHEWMPSRNSSFREGNIDWIIFHFHCKKCLEHKSLTIEGKN